MRLGSIRALLVCLLVLTTIAAASEHFVGNFAEPVDGGNLDTERSTFDGHQVIIIPRSHANEAVGGAVRWRTVYFAIRGVKGRTPAFELPLISPGTGGEMLSVDPISFHNIKLVWSYDPDGHGWNTFDVHRRTGTSRETWKVTAENDRPFDRDVVYVCINERAPVAEFYEWLEASVFVHPFVRPTPSEAKPASFIIGFQSGANASSECSRSIPDTPLYAFMIKDPSARPSKLVMLFSGQHPYEGQNKVALKAAVDWILNSTSAEAKAYRAEYLTVVYPFVNPTGEMAGLWRGTAAAPLKDTNRNWDTADVEPSQDRGIDTVIVHKNAVRLDIAKLGMGEPYAVFDYHQNFGDHADAPDYVLHATSSLSFTRAVHRGSPVDAFSPYYARLARIVGIADMPSELRTQETLRGYMGARGVLLPLTFERSVYHTLSSEQQFGVATVRALVERAPSDRVRVMPTTLALSGTALR
jgi:hypothetical protein